MTEFTDVLAAVKEASGKTASMIALFATTRARVDELLVNQMTPEIKAGLDEIFNIEKADVAAIDTAMNTPPTP